jgi:hypothetical protein
MNPLAGLPAAYVTRVEARRTDVLLTACRQSARQCDEFSASSSKNCEKIWLTLIIFG